VIPEGNLATDDDPGQLGDLIAVELPPREVRRVIIDRGVLESADVDQLIAHPAELHRGVAARVGSTGRCRRRQPDAHLSCDGLEKDGGLVEACRGHLV
jgi:hypothetical protein